MMSTTTTAEATPTIQPDPRTQRAVDAVADAIEQALDLSEELRQAGAQTGTPDGLTGDALDVVGNLTGRLLALALENIAAASAVATNAGEHGRQARLRPVLRELRRVVELDAAEARRLQARHTMPAIERATVGADA